MPKFRDYENISLYSCPELAKSMAERGGGSRAGLISVHVLCPLKYSSALVRTDITACAQEALHVRFPAQLCIVRRAGLSFFFLSIFFLDKQKENGLLAGQAEKDTSPKLPNVFAMKLWVEHFRRPREDFKAGQWNQNQTVEKAV
jgi:hypothetical protein